MPRQLWEKSIWYSLLRPYIDWCARRSYTSFKVEGSLPKDGRAMIIAPNHTNTLMDALVVMLIRPGETVFGARADIFRRPKTARALEFMRIVPIARERDGLRAVAENVSVIPRIIDVLHHGVPFCIFPEGRHRPMRSLLPIHKGVGRLALRNAETQPTCIVPVGITYSDFFHYRGTCHVRIGEPIDIDEWKKEHEGLHDSRSATFIGERVGEELKSLILYIPDDENYEQRLAELCPPRPRRWWEWPLAVLTAPLFALAAVLTLPLWLTAAIICHGLKDAAFRNTVRYSVRLVGEPIVFILWAVAGFICLPPLAACALLIFYIFAYSGFYDWLNLVRINY